MKLSGIKKKKDETKTDNPYRELKIKVEEIKIPPPSLSPRMKKQYNVRMVENEELENQEGK